MRTDSPKLTTVPCQNLIPRAVFVFAVVSTHALKINVTPDPNPPTLLPDLPSTTTVPIPSTTAVSTTITIHNAKFIRCSSTTFCVFEITEMTENTNADMPDLLFTTSTIPKALLILSNDWCMAKGDSTSGCFTEVKKLREHDDPCVCV